MVRSRRKIVHEYGIATRGNPDWPGASTSASFWRVTRALLAVQTFLAYALSKASREGRADPGRQQTTLYSDCDYHRALLKLA